MRETNTASSASVAGLELMRLGPELTFLAWNDRCGKILCRKLCRIAIPSLRTQDIASASMSQGPRVCMTGWRLAFGNITGILPAFTIDAV